MVESIQLKQTEKTIHQKTNLPWSMEGVTKAFVVVIGKDWLNKRMSAGKHGNCERFRRQIMLADDGKHVKSASVQLFVRICRACQLNMSSSRQYKLP